jgi:serpin B
MFRPEFENSPNAPVSLDLRTTSFSDTTAPDRINAWLSEKTGGQLDRVIDRVDPLAIMVGVNATFFSGRWQTPFATELTRTAPFNRPNSVSLPVAMMARQGRCLYQQRDGMQMAALPYGDGRVCLVVILPGEKTGLEQAISSLSEADWQAILAGFEETWGELRLPRFKISFEADLRAPLSRLGMGSAFDADRANFGGLVPIPPMPYVYFDHFHHKVVLEVTEEGSLADVQTAGIPVTGEDGGRVTALPPQPFAMTANRPFLAAILDRQTGALLFLAAVVDP